MQTFGYLWSMMPIVEELYDKDEDKVEALRTYTTFFNTEPQIGTMVVGLTVGLEEARANGEPMDAETINGIRAGLMGPLAGLGDSIIVGTFIPILLGIALGLSTGGNLLGPIFYMVAWNVIMYFGMKYAYDQGYTLGGNAVEALVGPDSAALRSSIVMIGTMVYRCCCGNMDYYHHELQFTVHGRFGIRPAGDARCDQAQILELLLRVAVLVAHDQEEGLSNHCDAHPRGYCHDWVHYHSGYQHLVLRYGSVLLVLWDQWCRPLLVVV